MLSKDDPSPLAPESDDEKEKKDADKDKDKEKDKDKDKKDAAKEVPKVKIDLEDIDQRTLALPLPPETTSGCWPARQGQFFLVEGPTVFPIEDDGDEPPAATVVRFDLEKRKTEKLVEGARQFAVCDNGEKMLYQHGEGWFLVGTGAPAKPGDGALKLDGLEVRVDPRAEWRQIYREVFRIERDFLYDPGFHGYDLTGAGQNTPRISTASAAGTISITCSTNCSPGCRCSTSTCWAATCRGLRPARCGLLGADYAVENGRHRFAKMYRGESWNPGLRAPLTQPGAGVKEGEYLLAVNGQEAPRRGRGLSPLRGDGRQADGAQGRPERRTARIAAK